MRKSRDLYSKCSVQRCISKRCRGAFLKGAELHFFKGAEVQRSQSITSVNVRKAEFGEEEKKVYKICQNCSSNIIRFQLEILKDDYKIKVFSLRKGYLQFFLDLVGWLPSSRRSLQRKSPCFSKTQCQLFSSLRQCSHQMQSGSGSKNWTGKEISSNLQILAACLVQNPSGRFSNLCFLHQKSIRLATQELKKYLLNCPARYSPFCTLSGC